ncbi:hypothetical protein N4P33_19505 [Streptomyces sp. 15-116A]|nr:hypothetical protein [Streptomyces sp. 15-116A]
MTFTVGRMEAGALRHHRLGDGTDPEAWHRLRELIRSLRQR